MNVTIMIPVIIQDAKLSADEVLDVIQAATDTYTEDIARTASYLRVSAQFGKSVAMQDGEAPY